MASGDIIIGLTPKAILDALGLGAGATRAQIIAAAEALEGKAPPTTGELAQLSELRQSLGLPNTAFRSEVLAAIKAKIPTAAEAGTFAAPSASMSRIALSMGLPADTPGAVVVAKTRELVAVDKVAEAIAERRVHRTQRTSLLELARHDFEMFQGALDAATERIGYATAAEEFSAIVDQREQILTQRPAGAATAASVRSYAALQSDVAREYPELMADVEAERRGRVDRADGIRSAASAALAEAVAKFTAAGGSWDDAIAAVIEGQPELVLAYTTGTDPK